MKDISIIIHSHSFEEIVDCVKSAKLLNDRILIIGEEKRQYIKDELLALGVKIIPFSNSGIVESARTFGINQVKTEWVFLLDADERMTPELAKELTEAVEEQSGKTASVISHYQIPRKEILFQKKWLKHGGWWPNYQTRLINRRYFVSWPTHIHSSPIIKGDGGKLKEALLHYSQNDFTEIVNRTIIFENMESELLFKAGRPVNTIVFFRKFFGELWRRLFAKFGFLDGTLGIIESIYQAFSKTITYIYLYETRIKKGSALRSLS